MISAAIMMVALGGYIASRYIPLAGAPMPDLHLDWNIARATWRIIDDDRKNRRVFLSILGISWFWLVGATFLLQFPNYAKDIIGGDASLVTSFLTVFSVGIGVGSFLCNKLLKGKIKSTYVSAAAIGMSVFMIDLYFASGSAHYTHEGVYITAWQFMDHLGGWRILCDLFAVAICGGLYIVPLYAIMQHDSDPATRARTIASNNVINALFMVISAVGSMLMLDAHYTPQGVLLTLAMLNLPVALWLRRI